MDGRPAFTKSFPRDPALDRLVDLFEQGNYAKVREDAPAVLAASEDAAVRDAVKEILRRLEPDPLAVGLVVTTLALLVILAGWYWTHPHEATPARSTPVGPAPVSS
jgi:hypothetical protein